MHTTPRCTRTTTNTSFCRSIVITLKTEEQQREAGSFGMWLFLLTEIMFFGGMFFSYLLYRNWYYDAFVTASNTLVIGWGALNTVILITSGFCMALGVYYAEVRNRRMLVLMLWLTTFFGIAFLGVKSIEYTQKFEDHHVPGASFNVKEFINPPLKNGVQTEKPLAAGYGAKNTALLLPVLRHDRHACTAHGHWTRYPVLVDCQSPGRRVQRGICCTP